MPHKTISEIRWICEKHKKLAFNKWCLEEDKKCKENQAVSQWLGVLKHINASHKETVQDIVPRALKYIALYEKRIEDVHISLSDCYLVLSDISNGVASKNLDEVSNSFFFECLTKLAEALKNGEKESYKKRLRNMRNITEIVNSDSIKENSALNPLRIPKCQLKMTEVDKRVDIME